MRVNEQFELQRELIRCRLFDRLHAIANRVDVIVDADGRIELYGTVCSFYQKQLAQEAVFHLPGVVEVVNHLEVDD